MAPPHEWPETMMTYGDEAADALADPASFQLFVALLEAPLDVARVAEVLSITRPEAELGLARLVEAGVVEPWRRDERAGTVLYRPAAPHLRGEHLTSARLAGMRRAMLRLAERAVEDAHAELAADPADTQVGISVVTLPGDEATIRAIVRILAEAEDKLRALGPARANAKHMRITMLAATQRRAKTP